ncbi:MAG: hypothetical protein ACI4EU_05155 [Butyrivibrio sp.]
MEFDYESLKALIDRQAGYLRERSLTPDELIRRYRYHVGKYTEYVADCRDGSWISHYINKKALEKLAAERGIELNKESGWTI